MICIFHHKAHLARVHLLVRLSSQRVNRWSLGLIQHLRLNKGSVYIFSHLSAQSVPLPHQMSLRTASNIRIAGHQGNAVHADGKNHRFHPKPCGSQSRLTAGMSGSHYCNIICLL